ncbi:hypothetical protein CLOM_g3896 [Closterium sp. NIES-68]|nr:hypothetical protein CLOM_g3896 [Closterium sp. NIES-68]GJP66814.1 hypothetical protein CLOP_g23712 [Closterium sp. NIES-67]
MHESGRSPPRLFAAGFLASQSADGSLTNEDNLSCSKELSLRASVVSSFEAIKAQGGNDEREQTTWRFLVGGGCGAAFAGDDAGFLWQVTRQQHTRQQHSKQHSIVQQGTELPETEARQERTEGAECAEWKGPRPHSPAEAQTLLSPRRNEPSVRNSGRDNGNTLLCAVRFCKQSANERVTCGECSQDSGVFVSTSGRLLQWDVTPTSGIDLAASPPPCYPLPSLPPWVTVTSVAVGLTHCLALSGSGMVWAWGEGAEGQLGMGRRVGKVTEPVCVLLPALAASAIRPSAIRASAVTASTMRPSAVTACASRDDSLQATAVACGGRHSLVLAEDGSLFSFGWGQYGQCGHGTSDDCLSPTLLSALTGLTVLPTLLDCPSLDTRAVKAISCGARHSAAVTTDGTLFVWGSNKFGQLGIGHKDDAYSPQMVAKDKFDINGCGDNESAGDKKLEHAREVFVQDAKCGWWHTLAITRGTVKSLNNG